MPLRCIDHFYFNAPEVTLGMSHSQRVMRKTPALEDGMMDIEAAQTFDLDQILNFDFNLPKVYSAIAQRQSGWVAAPTANLSAGQAVRENEHF